MSTLEQATCVFHPGKPASTTCKQCGKTVCHQCTVTGRTGKFCSTPCRTAHEARVIQAQDTGGRPRAAFSARLRGAMAKLLLLAAVFLAAAFVTQIIYIPVASPFINSIRDSLGF